MFENYDLWPINIYNGPSIGLKLVGVDLLLYVPPIVCRGSKLVFVLVCITLCPF